MFVAQDRTAHNWQIGVGADEIVGEHVQHIEQLFKNCCINHHGNMFLIEHDAVFIIIAIGGVLESPVSAVNGNGDRPEILPCRVCQRAGKTGVFNAKLACRIFGLGLVLGCGNVAWVFFRLGTVNGYVQCAVFAVICPT